MITFLEGILEEKNPSSVVLNVGGVGYEIIVSLGTFEALPPMGDRVRILTYHSVKEDSEQLFGFASQEERLCFLELISISGIGPSSALALLSGLPLSALLKAIAQGDVKTISSVKGIGKKTAERIIVELKDKLMPMGSSATSKDAESLSSAAADAIAALLKLGFRQSEVQESVTKILRANPDAQADQIIRAVVTQNGK